MHGSFTLQRAFPSTNICIHIYNVFYSFSVAKGSIASKTAPSKFTFQMDRCELPIHTKKRTMASGKSGSIQTVHTSCRRQMATSCCYCRTASGRCIRMGTNDENIPMARLKLYIPTEAPSRGIQMGAFVSRTRMASWSWTPKPYLFKFNV